MKTIILTIALILGSFAADINLQITNIKNNKGQISIGLYDKKDDFLDNEKVYKGVKIKSNNLDAKYSFKNIPNGTYAIALYHDEDNNDKLNTNFFGIPNEGTGLSNNARASFGPPKFDDAKFELKTKIELEIKLRY